MWKIAGYEEFRQANSAAKILMEQYSKSGIESIQDEKLKAVFIKHFNLASQEQ